LDRMDPGNVLRASPPLPPPRGAAIVATQTPSAHYTNDDSLTVTRAELQPLSFDAEEDFKDSLPRDSQGRTPLTASDHEPFTPRSWNFLHGSIAR
jgi:hypothetical protein